MSWVEGEDIDNQLKHHQKLVERHGLECREDKTAESGANCSVAAISPR